MPHKYDKGGKSYKQGRCVEQLFKTSMMKHPLVRNVRDATNYENTHSHIDFWVDHKTQRRCIPFSVKGMKRIHRSDAKPQDELFFVELRNYAHATNKLGWLFGTTAEILATQRTNYFLLICIEKLKHFILNNLRIDWERHAKRYNNTPSVYCPYYRRQSPKERDYFMLVPYCDICKHLSCKELRCQH